MSQLFGTFVTDSENPSYVYQTDEGTALVNQVTRNPTEAEKVLVRDGVKFTPYVVLGKYLGPHRPGQEPLSQGKKKTRSSGSSGLRSKLANRKA